MNSKRRAAKLLIEKKRSGGKVDEASLKKAYATLGIKPTKAKDFNARVAKKAAERKSLKEKVVAARKKRAERKEANVANPRKPKQPVKK